MERIAFWFTLVMILVSLWGLAVAPIYVAFLEWTVPAYGAFIEWLLQ